MGAGDDEIPFPAEDLLAEQFGHGDIVELAAEDLLDLRIPAALGVADDKEIHVGGQVLRLVTVEDGDAAPFEEGLHRIVDRAVGSRDAVSGIAEGGGDRAHRGAADAHEIEVFGGSAHGEREDGDQD